MRYAAHSLLISAGEPENVQFAETRAGARVPPVDHPNKQSGRQPLAETASHLKPQPPKHWIPAPRFREDKLRGPDGARYFLANFLKRASMRPQCSLARKLSIYFARPGPSL